MSAIMIFLFKITIFSSQKLIFQKINNFVFGNFSEFSL